MLPNFHRNRERCVISLAAATPKISKLFVNLPIEHTFEHNNELREGMYMIVFYVHRQTPGDYV